MSRKDPAVLPLVERVFIPDERKASLRARLRRIRGQIDGLERMLDGNRPCVEILTQIASAQQALRGASREMVRNYLETCATEALRAGRTDEVYDDLVEIIFKLTR
jgi:DNA-binding FrmR family transcriptional regulator